MDYFKQIDAYLKGNLTGSERSDFLKEMKRNPALLEGVELHKKADELSKRNDLEQIHAEYMRKRMEKN